MPDIPIVTETPPAVPPTQTELPKEVLTIVETMKAENKKILDELLLISKKKKTGRNC
jgi:hypothetical protein